MADGEKEAPIEIGSVDEDTISSELGSTIVDGPDLLGNSEMLEYAVLDFWNLLIM